MNRSPKLLAAALAAALLPGLAFASSKDDARLMQTRAEAAIAAAERAEADTRAAPSLQDARALLAQGEGSFDDRDYRDAEREFERAAADARLAEARARQARNEQVTDELSAAIEALRTEINRLETEA
ncbi:DUF4398 domain-containing protein [Pseudomarimonas salicorniae]|uniref:DUF4398 domain-containing protein n=1 Tax=Pseudomarimonas salicorniae TaxID=2933270 RepID=A0ABT0GFC2_9GAMM|nr:DUF4398 domain-containing protein [Lysobacter sp. CAU 1642]MCK7593243.1 DUF4398 domain-containing protein [Lysobacter sp. CAU 1642]